MLDALLGNDSPPAAAASDAIRRLLVLLEVADTVTQRLSLDHQLPRLIDLIVEDTHTCYLGDRAHRHAWGYGCGNCPACELRARGWERYVASTL